MVVGLAFKHSMVWLMGVTNTCLLSASHQGTCFMPIVYFLSGILGANGVAATHAVADILTLFLAIPIIRSLKFQSCEIEKSMI